MENRELLTSAKKIKLIALDNDGVLTGGQVMINDYGGAAKSYDIRDGLGVIMARKVGITFAIITGLKSPIVEERARQLGIEEVHQGLFDKCDILKHLLIRHNISSAQAAYMGDDIIDIPVFDEVGLSAAPANAHIDVLKKADWIAKCNGGMGAVRELTDFILKSQGKYDHFLSEGDKKNN